MQANYYKIKVCPPNAFFWVTKLATSESMAKSMALGQHANRFGWYVGQCDEVKEKESA